MGESYNQQLVEKRNELGLTLRQAAKQIGIGSLTLFLYETGYFRPGKSHLAKIQAVYGPLDFSGEKEYPKESPLPAPRKPRKRRLIISGAIAALSLGLILTGGSLFFQSASNATSSFGQIYRDARTAAIEKGVSGRDIFTDLEYSVLYENSSAGRGDVAFYKTNSILYFNHASYSSNSSILDYPDLGSGRFHFQFGGDQGKSSYICSFNYKSSAAGVFFSCEAYYENKPIEMLLSLNPIMKGTVPITDELAIGLFNAKIKDATKVLSRVLTEGVGRDIDFYNDFLSAREEGRIVNWRMQVVGLSLLLPSLLIFFGSFAVLILTLIKMIKYRPKEASEKEADATKKPLPKDLDIPFGVPEYMMVWFSRGVSAVSLVMLAFCFIVGRFVSLPPIFSNETFLNVFKMGFAGGILLKQLVNFSSVNRRRAVPFEAAKFALLYLGIASVETILIEIAEAWGYDIASLIYAYVPGNIFLAAALNYFVYYFLFFTPPFIKGGKKVPALLWRLLSLVPLGAIVAVTVFGKSYELFYGVKKNVYLLIWLSNSQPILSAVSVLFIYALFFAKLFYGNLYGEERAKTFYNGNRFILIHNLWCCGVVLLVGLFDLVFIDNEVAHYIGLGSGLWILFLIPLIFVTKYGPNQADIHFDIRTASAFLEAD